jgi:DNA-nicking Smr family endonuclease
MSRKNFEVPDHGLWDEVKRAIQPLSLRKQLKAKSKIMGIMLQQQTFQVAAEPIIVRKQLRDQPPAISSFDRRTTQKLGRGQAEPEARLDLHGENLETARMQLLNFVSMQRQRGVRLVLVITGKGASPYARHTLHGHSHFHTPEREGKLRREVPLMFHEAIFRAHIVGFQPAHPKHGGGGAFYVKLRKRDGVHS